MFGLQNNLINIALSLPLVLAGTLVSSIGLQPVLWLTGGVGPGGSVDRTTVAALLTCVFA